MDSAGAPVDDLGLIWEYFADSSCRGYSPIYDRVCRSVARDIELLDLVRSSPPPAHQPNVLLGAVHFVLLDGLEHPLKDVYEGRSSSDPSPLFKDLCMSQRDRILSIMETRRTQTNECGRSALIGPMLSWVQGRSGAPLHLVDVGASAGLNLLCDSYYLDYGELGTSGPADAAVRVECRVLDGAPPVERSLPHIATRVGVDREPVDITDPDDVRWLLACVWPDTGRIDRTRLAIENAKAHAPRMVKGDALDVMPGVLADLPPEGTACVMTTWSFSYFSSEARGRFVQLLQDAAARRDVVWISCDGLNVVEALPASDVPHHDGNEPSVLGALEFREGLTPEPTVLGYGHPHGQWIDWRAG